ncbi:SEC14-like protein 2 [Strongylocentrotus purpuratus]|uniref:SEC14-like protein 2 n=1 Tax=Strongylocentrotus purpuratus TaxID=7668 RepID=A0A7M7RCV0_STRPU|nr:SEC14-like protein 2 [Strongylocentrotus purpuratus]|eukprot:XP_789550.2 PREDICTED: SEC14-like protein 2 [Strongylocentrotus purpuratus]
MATEAEKLGITSKQYDTFLKFKERVSDAIQPYHDDYWLRRFLRGKKFDIKKAESLFRKDIVWREENKVATIAEDFKTPEVLEKYRIGGMIGFGKDGRPIFLDPFGLIDFKGLLHAVTQTDLMKFYIQRFSGLNDLMIEQSKKLNTNVEGIHFIMDFEHLGRQHLSRPSTQLQISIVNMCEAHFPELLFRIYILRSPRLFPLLYSLISPFLGEHTRNRAVFCKDNFKEVLLKYIDADVLPVYWGGTKEEDGDGQCPSLVRRGGKVPKELYLTGRTVSIDPSQMTKKEISSRGSLELTYNVTKPDSVINYEFRTQDNDIGFGIKFIAEDGTKTVIAESQHLNCHRCPETGTIELKDPGTYVVKFDNSYSWTRSKKLFYWIELLETDETVEEQVKNQVPQIEIESEFLPAEEG